MGSSPQTFIIWWNSVLSLWEYELRGSMWLAALLEHGNTIKEQGGEKHIRLSLLYFQEVLLVCAVRWVHLTNARLNEETICCYGNSNYMAFTCKQCARRSEVMIFLKEYLLKVFMLAGKGNHKREVGTENDHEAMIWGSCGNATEKNWKSLSQLRPCSCVN